jgi:DNA-directed RNA polymerase subunit RPC12/RpoP
MSRGVKVAATRVFPCEACGAELEFHTGQQQLVCPHCGSSRPIAATGKVEERDLRAALARLSERRRGDDKVVSQTFRCQACAAEILFDGTLTSTTCAYCGVPVQRDAIHTSVERLPVDGLLPFALSATQAQPRLRAWVQSRWFAPSEFRRRGISGALQGAYLPYWSFDAHTGCEYSGQRGDHYWETVRRGDRTERERRTRWTSVSGSFEHFFDDVLAPATGALPSQLLQGLEPWPLERLKPFQAEHLAGFQARTYDVSLGDGFASAQERMRSSLEAMARNRIGGDEQRLSSVEVSYGALGYRHLLLPLYLLSYRYGEKVYRVMVNAGTGEVHGERPWSGWKIAAFVLSLGLAVAAVLLALSARQA